MESMDYPTLPFAGDKGGAIAERCTKSYFAHIDMCVYHEPIFQSRFTTWNYPRRGSTFLCL